MTAPAPLEPYPYEQPPPDDDDNPVVAAVIAALVVFFASSAAISAVLLPARLVEMLVSLGIAPKAARAAGKLALSVPMTGRSRYGAPTLPDNGIGPGSGPAAPGNQPGPGPKPAPKPSRGSGGAPSMSRRVAADEPRMRARYVYNAARRLTIHLVDGTFLPGLQTERNNLQAHVRAGRNRQAAAQALDDVAQREGPLLQWVAILDDRTTPDCRALNGRIFTVDNPPAIPGAVHPRCRCKAVGADMWRAV